MIVLVAHYQAKSGHGDEVEEILIAMADMVETYEADCLLYQVSRSREQPDHFVLYEQYLDEAAVQAHRETAYFKSHILDRVIPLLLVRDVKAYELIVG